VLLVDTEDGAVTNLTEGEPRSHLMAFWQPEGKRLLTVGWEHARAQVCLVDESGSNPIWSGDYGLPDYSASIDASGTTVAMILSTSRNHGTLSLLSFDRESIAGHPEIRIGLDQRPEVLPPLDSEWLSWKSTDEKNIEGLFIRPVTGDGGPSPLVTLIHGGPTGVATAGYALGGSSGWIPFLLRRGIAVFLPNYRGSNGYGVAFAEANVGDLGGLDLDDVLTGVDHCVDEGLADPDKLGVGGWSYGGYLTPLAITRTNRFKAAVSGASITNWFSFHGGCNIPGFDRQFIGASPHELDGPYAWRSPLFFASKVSTPTLFIHGEQDPVCPVGQAYEMTRALRMNNVSVECAIYPREGHGFVEREHLRDMIERAVGWFTTHLAIET
jgi:dipeptidyl aminopeptidase/acylaminoacyl peptidase